MIWQSLDIRTFTKEAYAYAYGMLDDQKRERMERTRQRKDKLRTVMADYLARDMLSRLGRCKPEEVAFAYEENGRPLVKGLPYFLSISHSENIVTVAVHERAVGIDVEKMRDMPLSLARRYFCGEEQWYLFGHEPKDADFDAASTPETTLRFFEIWTAKEAYLKSQGKGISHLKAVNTTAHSFERHLLAEDYLVTIYTE